MMKKEQKIVSNVIWGVGAAVGIVLANKIRDIGVAAYMKKRNREELDEVIVEELESE